jgi:hypothetical protein
VPKFSKYSILVLEKKKKKICKDFSVGRDLTEFAKIPTVESLIFFFFINGYFKIFDRI